jgi:sortase A
MNTYNDPEAAANLIRRKVDALYKQEPNAKKELQKARATTHHSMHQQYMLDLSKSGKSLSEIQTAWHEYYQNLPDAEKHNVWNEFYRQYENQRQPNTPIAHPQSQTAPHVEQKAHKEYPPTLSGKMKAKGAELVDPQNVSQLKKQLIHTIKSQASGKKRKQNLKSLGFGLAAGFITLLIFLFGFFNERFVAPFITPSRTVSSAPIIIDPSAAPAGDEPLIFIPKINLQVPVIFDEPSVSEEAVQNALEDGVIKYATTPNPGEKGNSVIFGHSSNNIFNNGKYKFAFVLLSQLENGDTFTVQKDGVRYVYKVFNKKVVSPSELSVLGSIKGKESTMSLITCDPPGTSVNRLVVIGEQISPSPSGNKQSSATVDETPTILPSNAPSLWSRFTSWMSN